MQAPVSLKKNRKVMFVIATIIAVTVTGDFIYTLSNPNTGYGITTVQNEQTKEIS